MRLSSDPRDPIILSELFNLFYEPVVRILKRQFPKENEDDIREMAYQSIEKFAQAPQKFDPQKKTLLGYLIMSATGDLINDLKRKGNERNWTIFVEDWTFLRNKVEEASDREMETEVVNQYLAKLKEFVPNEPDFSIAQMMEMGIRSTKEFAKVLKIEQLPDNEQRAIVKRHKDRIGKQLQRNDWEAIKKQIRDQSL